MSLYAAGKEYDLGPGTILFYGPEHPHRISSVAGEEFHKYFLTVLPTDSAGNSPRYGSVFCLRDSLPVLRSFEELIDYGLDPSPAASLICLTIFRLILQKCEFLAVDYGQIADRKFASYKRCKSILLEHFAEFRSLKEAAGRCAVSEGYLCKLFEKFDHQTPYSLLLTLRMNQAVRLVLESDLPINEIACRAGYEDQGHFSRTFRKVHGASPLKMRTT